MRRSSTKIAVLLIAGLVWGLPAAFASQQTGTTVRHHKVAEQDDPISPEIDQAEAAIQKQDYSTAEDLLKKVAGNGPQSYRAWFDLGYVYTQTNRTEDAVEAYRKSVEARPDVFESNLNLGVSLGRLGKNAEAATYLKAATQLKPTANTEEGLARAWQSLGIVEEAADPQQALAAFAQAAKLTPNDPEPHVSAAVLLERQNKLDEAAAEYQAAAKIAPQSTEPIAGLANVHAKQKKYAEAETELRGLLALDPNNGNAEAQLAQVLDAEGKSDQAAALLKPGTASTSGDPVAALNLGTMYVKAGNYDAAEKELRAAVDGMPYDAEAHFALGSLLMARKRYAESEQELQVAAHLKPGMTEVYGNLAVVAAENKNYSLAIEALDQRAKYLPDSPATYFLRATSYDNLKVTAKAIENYKRFLATDDGKNPDQEWQARHRLLAIAPPGTEKHNGKN